MVESHEAVEFELFAGVVRFDAENHAVSALPVLTVGLVEGPEESVMFAHKDWLNYCIVAFKV